MKIGIGNDHVAVEMKNEIKAYLEEKGHDSPKRTKRKN